MHFGANFGANFGAFWCKFWCILKMNNKDKIITKLKEENEYLKSLLQMRNISFEKPKKIKRHLIGIVTVGIIFTKGK